MKRRDKLAGGRLRSGTMLWAAAMLAVAALVLAGCGSSGGSSGDSSTTASASSGSEGSSSSSSEAGGAEGGTGATKFEISEEDRQCLKEKGVELPEFKSGEGPQRFQQGEMPEGAEPPTGGAMPEGGPPGMAMSEQNKEAFEECGVEVPEFKMGPGGTQAGGGPMVNSAAFRKQVKEYVACVRENGYELAEPDFSGEGPIFEKSESESEAFKQASEKCQDLLGGPQVRASEGVTEAS
jgi:hypothetical protein